ncbi:hypothetical protein LSCM4_01208 [Leishmania orientalis]|uniref:3-hydroxyacyl-CoA dehydrogenase C-terminal domain-containing protein n=1 Tax=Leishmania orientalis TaxID=2249476 RepID=A0A836KA84_9TRYP|nr:hypothetical protein LSCM4_01208 [Leishmania orientalis]
MRRLQQLGRRAWTVDSFPKPRRHVSSVAVGVDVQNSPPLTAPPSAPVASIASAPSKVKPAPSAPAAPKPAPSAPVAPAAPKPAPSAPVAPAAPKPAPSAPVAPAAPKPAPSAPVAPAAPKPAPSAPVAPAAPKPAPSAPVAPAAPKPAPSAPVAPAAPKPAPSAPVAPAAPKPAPSAPVAPAAPKPAPSAPVAPAAPKPAPSAPVAPAAPKPAPSAPVAPAAPKPAPSAPVAPAAPKPAPSAPVAPAAPKPAPSAPVAPAAPKPAPSAPVAPAAPKPAPSAPAAPKPAPSAPYASHKEQPQKRRVFGARDTVERARSSSRDVRPQASEHLYAGGRQSAASRLSFSQYALPNAADCPAVSPPPSPPPPSTLRTHAIIAPSSMGAVPYVDCKATEGKLFEALGASLSTRIEAAVRQGKAAQSLKASRISQRPLVGQPELEILRADAKAHAGSSEAAAEGAAGDWAWAQREDRLQPLPASFSDSIERHEIPTELGGDGGGNASESTTARPSAEDSQGEATASAPAAPLSSALAAELFETATMERLPGDLLCGSDVMSSEKGINSPPRPLYADNSDVCLVVSTSVTPQLYAITVQLREPPSSPMASLQAVAGALDAVEAHCDAAVTAYAEGRPNSTLRAAPNITVTWCTLPQCPFFVATQSPAELSLSQRVRYVEAKEAVMKRFHHLVARFGRRVCFAAVASSASVLDFGAEVFFACPVRQLLSVRAAVRDGGDNAAEPMEPPSPTDDTVSVGFPLSRVGIFPSSSTVVSLQRLCGSLRAVKWIPVLHTYDASSLAHAGLLSLPDTIADALGKRKASQWSLFFEQLILERVCQSPAQRRWAVEMLLWSGGAHNAAVRQETAGAMAAAIADSWYVYAVECLSLKSSSTEVDAARVGDAASATGAQPLLTAAPCRGAAHAVQVRMKSLRRSLPPLPHHRFLAFPHAQYSLWVDKVQALTTTESAGAAVLLDCSDKAVKHTLELVETHLVGTAAQRSRLPYLNVTLIGEASTAQPVLQRLPCAAVVSSASAFYEMGHASVQQVRLFSSPKWPTDLQQDTLLAALTYLKHRGVPHVVAASAAPQRLLLALCEEAVLVAHSLPDATTVESAAKEQLGLFLGPFGLMDAYGTVAVASMAAEERKRATMTKDATAPAAVAPVYRLESCMRSMAREGLLGARGARGGFYGPAAAMSRGGAAAPLLREAVLSTYVRHRATPAQVGDRLRAAVLNVACELLTEGEVQRTDDVDLLSMSALGWREETGGVLYQADHLGADALPRLVEHMTWLASTGVAPHLAPHPLLLRMVTEKVRFANLHTSGLL